MTEQIHWRTKQPEELETLPAGTKPSTSHRRPPGGERRGERKRSTIFLERTREGHRFKGNVRETSERWGGAHMGFFERINTILK